jgi:hypothetical protein
LKTLFFLDLGRLRETGRGKYLETERNIRYQNN